MTWQDKFILLKTYFGKGNGELSVFKPLIYLGGAAAILTEAVTFEAIVILGILYAILCFAIGWIWDILQLYEFEKEFTNKRDKFVKDMMDNIKRKK